MKLAKLRSLPGTLPGSLPALLLCLATVQAQEQSLDSLQPIQGEAIQGKLRTIDADGKLKLLVGEDETTRDLAEFRHIDFGKSGRELAPLSPQGLILLRSGIQIPGKVKDANARRLTITSPMLDEKVTLGLSHILAIRFARLTAENDGGFSKYVLEPKADKDLIYMKTADKIVQRSVTIIGFGDGKVEYSDRSGSIRSRRLTSLYGVVMAVSSGFAPDLQPRTRVVLGMEGGTFIRGKLKEMNDEHCVLELAEKATLKVNRLRLRRITVESNRLVFLSDLEPKKVERTKAFRNLSRTAWLKNRSPLGEGIQLGGTNPRTTYNGLVLIPKTRLTYTLDGDFDFFVATIGIENRSTGPAHAVFRVLQGDKVLFESKPITRQSEPLPIKVPVDKVKELTIEADFGKNFDFGDHCVFAEARVIKKGS